MQFCITQPSHHSPNLPTLSTRKKIFDLMHCLLNHSLSLPFFFDIFTALLSLLRMRVEEENIVFPSNDVITVVFALFSAFYDKYERCVLKDKNSDAILTIYTSMVKCFIRPYYNLRAIHRDGGLQREQHRNHWWKDID